METAQVFSQVWNNTDKGLPMKKAKLYVETITDGTIEMVWGSKIRPAKREDIRRARHLHSLGVCPHNVVFDVEGYPYDLRICAICKKDLGTV